MASLMMYLLNEVLSLGHHRQYTGELASERTFNFDGEIWSISSQPNHLLVVLFYFVFIGNKIFEELTKAELSEYKVNICGYVKKHSCIATLHAASKRRWIELMCVLCSRDEKWCGHGAPLPICVHVHQRKPSYVGSIGTVVKPGSGVSNLKEVAGRKLNTKMNTG